MKYIIIAIILLLFLSWNINHAVGQESKSNIQKPIIFQSRDSLWTKDTIGCFGYRSKHASIIEDNKDQFIGKSESEIKEIFGKPTYTKVFSDEIRYTYYLAVSPDCESIYSDKLTWKEIEAATGLDFSFNIEGKLTGIAFWIQ
jgi:hypothetical protein